MRQRFRKHRLPLLHGLELLPGLPLFPRRPAALGLGVRGAVSPPAVPRGEEAAEAAEVRRVRPPERRDTHPPLVGAVAATRTDASIALVLIVL